MRRGSIVVALAFACAAPRAARAGSASDLQSLLEESVVETASKSLETASTAPATSQILTAEDLQRHGIHSLDEALNYLSTSFVVEGGQHNKDIGARGVLISADTGNHVLLLVNGHVLNEQWGGSAYFERGTGIPLEVIDHIEVIVGPGSVLYGSNAMLGVINIVTKRAKDFGGVHLVVESELPISVRAMAGFGREFRIFGKKAEATTAVEVYAQQGPAYTLGPTALGNGVPYSVDGRGTSGVWGGYPASQANYALVPSMFTRVIVGDFEVNARAALYKRQSPWSYGPYDDPNGYDLDHWMSLDVRHHAWIAPWVGLSSRAYADSYSYFETLDQPNTAVDCPTSPVGGCTFQLRGAGRWGGVEEQLTLDWSKDGRFPTLIGVDARLKDLHMRTDYYSAGTGANPSPAGIFPCATSASAHGVPCTSLGKQLAVYGEQKIKPHPRVGISAGARLDVDDAYSARVSPRIAATTEPWHGGTLKAIYAEAFRAPTVYERFFTDVTQTVAAPNLAPETVRSIEASVEHRFNGQRIFATVYRSWWYGLVSSAELSAAEIARFVATRQLLPHTATAYQNQNINALDSYGYTLAFEGTALRGRLRYGVAGTGAWARQTAGGETPSLLPAAARYFGNARVSYEVGSPFPTLGLVGRFTSPRLAALSAPAVDAPPMGSMRLAATGKVPVVRGLSYGLAGDYSFTATAPYAVGPGNLPTGPQLIPVDRLRFTATLAYEFDP